LTNYTRSNHDILGPGADAVVLAYAAARVGADTTIVLLDDVTVTWTHGPRLITQADTADVSLGPGDAVVKVHAAARAQADALLGVADTLAVRANQITHADALLGVADALVKEHGAVRVNADGGVGLSPQAADTLAWLEYIGRTQADTADVSLGPGDAAQRAVDSVRTNADGAAAVTGDDVVKVHGAVRVNDDALLGVADAADMATGFGRVQADVADVSLGPGDAAQRAVGWQRSNADGAVAVDAANFVAHDFTHHEVIPGPYGYNHGVVDAAWRAVTSVRTQADGAVAVAGDALDVELTVRPRNVFVRHVYPGPSLVVQHRDWEKGGVAYNRTGNNVYMPLLVLRRGQANTLLASNVGGWSTSGKDYLATMVAKNQARFYEEYLGRTTRQLSASQVSGYVARNSPWITWVQHKALAGAPVANEVAPGAVHGLQALDWNQLRVKVLFTGGAAPTCKITAWHREVLPTSKGPWTEGQTEVNVQHRVEFTIVANTYREVWLQVHTLSGLPTGVAVWVSGC